MPGLQLNLFGKPEILLNGTAVTAFESAKSPALLFYLAVTGQAHSRDTLATLLWGDLPEATAKRNLTKALTNLRQLLDPYVLIERHSVAFNHQLLSAVDVTIFQAAIEASALLEPDDPERDLAPLRQATSLYRGDFLEGFYVKNALEFEEWALGQREYLRELMLRGLHRLTEQSARLEADPAVALAYCQRWLALEPWQEAAHRQMMLLLVRAGQREAALAQYETCRRVLAEELGVEPVTETTMLYERLKAAGTPPPHNLPLTPNDFVGREADLEQIAVYLARPTCRLLTIVGPGGIGKTRLALQAARRYLQPEAIIEDLNFADGIYLVNLAPLDSEMIPATLTDQLAGAIAAALNYSLHGATEICSQVCHFLGDKEMLLVLDNFDTVAAGADILSRLLHQASGVKLLVTSRERLNLQEEWTLAVEGLDYPVGEGITGGAGCQHPTVGSQSEIRNQRESSIARLPAYSAIALFVQRAQQVQPAFTLSEAEASSVIRICQLVEGMPLGLELAASWLRVLSCQEIAAEIERSFAFLTTSWRNIPERHRSLQAVFESSWKLLSAAEQAAMQKLSVFRGGFYREAGREVTGTSLSNLAGLVDKSFLKRAATGRYEIHELVRQYAAEKLAQHPMQAEEARRHHCRYFARFLQERSDLLKGEQQAATLQEIALEIDNIRAGWQQTIVPGLPVAVAEIDQCIYSLRTLYERRGWYQEGLDMFSRMAQRLAGLSGASSNPEQITVYGRVLLQVGFFQYLLGNYQAAAALYQQSLKALQASPAGQPDLIREQAYALRLLGNIYQRYGDYETAKELIMKGITLLKTIGDTYQEAHLAVKLGVITFEIGNYEEAEQILRHGWTVLEVFGDRWDLADSIGYLGQIAYLMGREAEAEQLLAESLAMSRKVGDPWVMMRALQHRGCVLNLMAEAAPTLPLQRQIYTEAGQILQQSLAISREINIAFFQAFSLNQLGYTNMGLGESRTAQACFSEALKIAGKLQAISLILDILIGLAMILNQSDRPNLQHQPQAIRFLNLALNHPAATRQTQKRAATFLDKAGLSPEMLATQGDNESNSLEQVVADILGKPQIPPLTLNLT